MLQQGQVFKLRGGDGRDVWAFRYRLGGRGSRRVQRGGFASERDGSEALERALERVRRERGCGSALTLGEVVDEYLAQHDGEPETVEKLRWLLRKPVKPAKQGVDNPQRRYTKKRPFESWVELAAPGAGLGYCYG